MTTALARGFAALAVGATALLGSALVHLPTPVGRRAFAEAIEAAIDHEIPGHAEIGSVQRLGFDRIVAREIELSAPDGSPVLILDQVELQPALERLLFERTIATRWARVDGARLWMVQEDRDLELEEAFESPSRSSGSPTLLIDFNGVHFEGLESEWRLDGLPSFHLDDARGFVRVRTDPEGNAVVRFDRIEGIMRIDGLPLEPTASVRTASGRVRAGADRVADFAVALDVDHEPVELSLDLFDREGGIVVHGRLAAEPVTLGWIGSVGIDLATELSGGFRGDIEVVDRLGDARLARSGGGS